MPKIGSVYSFALPGHIKKCYKVFVTKKKEKRKATTKSYDMKNKTGPDEI